MPRLPQRGLSEGVKMVAKAAATLVKQRAVLVKFLPPGSCGSNNLQKTMGCTPASAAHDGGSSLMFTMLATSTVPGRDVVIEYVRMAMATNDGGPGGSTNTVVAC